MKELELSNETLGACGGDTSLPGVSPATLLISERLLHWVRRAARPSSTQWTLRH